MHKCECFGAILSDSLSCPIHSLIYGQHIRNLFEKNRICLSSSTLKSEDVGNLWWAVDRFFCLKSLQRIETNATLKISLFSLHYDAGTLTSESEISVRA